MTPFETLCEQLRGLSDVERTIALDVLMGQVAIYALVDPTTDTVRYIGQSVNPKRRVYSHQHNGQGVRAWLVELEQAGVHPDLRVLEWTDAEKASERERSWREFHSPDLNKQAVQPAWTWDEVMAERKRKQQTPRTRTARPKPPRKPSRLDITVAKHMASQQAELDDYEQRRLKS